MTRSISRPELRNRGMSKSRSARGNILVLMLAILLGVVLVIAIFALWFNSYLGAHQEQKTAIESAALAAADDLDKVVVEDPYFGFVSLSDSPPTGKATIAQDNYFLHVESINTILATIRLDMIVSDLLKDPLMLQYAQRDYGHAMSAKDRLIAALTASIQPGAIATDKDGNSFSPVADATKAYQSNTVRLTRKSAVLVPGSLKLSLGYINGLSTNRQIPQPAGSANVTEAQQHNGFYNANINVPYDHFNFVFAAVGDNTALVDQKKFQSALSGLPYSFPTIVKCDADEQYSDIDQSGAKITRKIHAIAAAEPASLVDKDPAPGALTFTFPNGMPSTIKSPLDLWATASIENSPADRLETPVNGDYPTSPLSAMVLPLLKPPSFPPVGQVMSVAFYDWLRRSGPNINMQSVADMLNSRFDTTIGTKQGQMHIYEKNAQGTINYKSVSVPPTEDIPISNKQWRMMSGYPVSDTSLSKTNPTNYDLIVKDYVFQPGRIEGGIHAGEPLETSFVTAQPVSSTIIGWSVPEFMTPAFAQANPTGPVKPLLLTDYPNWMGTIPSGPAGGANRPTYTTPSIAVDVTLRLRQ
jgi:hypothetical protein